MNRTLGMASALCNVLAVSAFALSMLLGSQTASYFFSMWIAFGFVGMMCAFCHRAPESAKTAGFAALAVSCIYAVMVLLVYFEQLTVVARTSLTDQAAQLLDFQRFNLFFHYDLLGYAMMSLATFFAGLTIHPADRGDKWLRRLLLIHGIFFVSCLVLPLAGVFDEMPEAAWVGTAVLELWCFYFLPVGCLACRYFAKDVRV